MQPGTNATDNLIWDCPNCGQKRVQGDVCPTCGTFRDAIKAGPQFKTFTSPAAMPDRAKRGWDPLSEPPKTRAVFGGEPAPPLDPSLIGGTGAAAPESSLGYEPPVTSEDFGPGGKQKNGAGWSSWAKPKNDGFAGSAAALGVLPVKEPFLFNRANNSFAYGISRTLARSWSGHILTIMFTVGAVLFFAYAFDQYSFLTALNARGVQTNATVTNTVRRVSSGKSSSTSYYVDFTYYVADTLYSVEQSVGYATYAALRIGETIPVKYLPEAPNRARLSGAYADDNGIVLMLVAAIVGLVSMLVWSILWLNRTLRQARLARDGQIVIAQVIGSNLSRSKSTYTLNLRYSFTSPTTGTVLKRKESTVRNDLKPNGAPAVGREVRVVYLNDGLYRVL